MVHTVGSLLLSLSCSGALMIILICAISYLFRKKSSFRWQYYIWLFVIARLLLPFAPEGNLMERLGQKFEVQMQHFQGEGQITTDEGTIYSQTNTEDTQGIGDTNQKLHSEDNTKSLENTDQKSNSTNNHQDMQDTGQRGIPADNSQNIGDTIQNANPVKNNTDNQEQNLSTTSKSWKTASQRLGNILQKLGAAQKYLLIFWLTVAVFLIIRKITIYQCFVRYIQAGSTPISDISRLEALSAAEQELGIKRALELWGNPMVSSPMLIGIIHPCIVLPESTLSEKAFHYTILHELIHYKRRDLIYKWLGQLVLCIHWFNPLVYVMAANIGRLCELSCDETVNRHLSSDEGRREYAKTLLEAAKTGGDYREHLASITLSENKKMLKERLEAIMSYKKMTTRKKLLVTVLTAGIFISALYTGSYTTSAKSNSKLVTKPKTSTSATSNSKPAAKTKTNTSASSSSKTTSKSKSNTSATSNSRLAAKPKAKTSASSSSKTTSKSKSNTSATSNSKLTAKPKAAKSSTTITLKGAKKQNNDKITAAQADKMALALTKKIWVWDWVAFYVPYMSDAGIKKLLPASRQADWAGSVDFTTGKKIKFTKKKINAARKNKTSESLTREDIDKHALMIMQSNGNWDCISAMLPYMSHSGIDAVVRCYNSKQFENKKHAEDYY